MNDAVQGAFEAAKENDSLLQWINGVKDGIASSSQGAATDASISMDNTPEIGNTVQGAETSITSIDDQAAKYAWQLVQQKINSGELTDPKALSSELNSALNRAFGDYGINPNSSDAENSKQIAKDIIFKSKDLETLYACLLYTSPSPRDRG